MDYIYFMLRLDFRRQVVENWIIHLEYPLLDGVMMLPTKVMTQVCTRCFSGDWKQMKEYARRYDPAKNPPLGKTFRDLIGNRNRSEFWREVAKRDVHMATDEIANGDSLSGMIQAVDLCRQGRSISIVLDGKIIGKLVPATE